MNEKTYLREKPCRAGHEPALHYIKGDRCIECVRLRGAYSADDLANRKAAKIASAAEARKHKAAYDIAWKKANRDSIREQAKIYRMATVEKKREQVQRWEAENKERRRDVSAAWREANAAFKKQQDAAYRKANADKVRASSSAQRARRLEAAGTFTKADVERLYTVQGGRCVYCSIKLSRKFQVDHIMPLALGGSNAPQNLQLLCAKCNQSKGAKHPVDFARRRGLLL